MLSAQMTHTSLLDVVLERLFFIEAASVGWSCSLCTICVLRRSRTAATSSRFLQGVWIGSSEWMAYKHWHWSVHGQSFDHKWRQSLTFTKPPMHAPGVSESSSALGTEKHARNWRAEDQATECSTVALHQDIYIRPSSADIDTLQMRNCFAVLADNSL